mgnify:FL=1|jgi:hypothetical protein
MNNAGAGCERGHDVSWWVLLHFGVFEAAVILSKLVACFPQIKRDHHLLASCALFLWQASVSPHL